MSRKRLRVDPSILRENAVPERKVRPRREPQSPTRQRNSSSRSRLIGLCRRRQRPGPVSGRLLHEGGVVLARGCAYCTSPGPSWSTPDPPSVAPHPRAVHARCHPSNRTRPADKASKDSRVWETRPADVSDVMTSETLRSHETTQKARGSCSTHNPWPGQPHPRAVADLRGSRAADGVDRVR